MNLDELRGTLSAAIAEGSDDELLELAGALEIARLRIQRRLAPVPAGAPTSRPSQHMTVEEIAPLLKFEVPYTYALARRGVFGPVLKEGKYVRVSVAGFEAYLRRSRGPSSYVHGRKEGR